MALARCSNCGDPGLAAGSCRRCGQRSDARRSQTASGVLVERTDPLSVVLRRILVVLLCVIVGGTWYAASAYTRSQLEQVDSDAKAAECNEIEQVGERYYGELSECRHEVAALRLRERK